MMVLFGSVACLIMSVLIIIIDGSGSDDYIIADIFVCGTIYQTWLQLMIMCDI